MRAKQTRTALPIQGIQIHPFPHFLLFPSQNQCSLWGCIVLAHHLLPATFPGYYVTDFALCCRSPVQFQGTISRTLLHPCHVITQACLYLPKYRPYAESNRTSLHPHRSSTVLLRRTSKSDVESTSCPPAHFKICALELLGKMFVANHPKEAHYFHRSSFMSYMSYPPSVVLFTLVLSARCTGINQISISALSVTRCWNHMERFGGTACTGQAGYPLLFCTVHVLSEKTWTYPMKNFEPLPSFFSGFIPNSGTKFLPVVHLSNCSECML